LLLFTYNSNWLTITLRLKHLSSTELLTRLNWEFTSRGAEGALRCIENT